MLLRWLSRLGGVLLLSFAVSLTASAQYGGGGTGSMGSGYGSSNAKAIGIGVGVGAAAAAVGIVLYVRHRHHEAANATKSQAQTSVITQSEINKLSFKGEKDLYRTISNSTPMPADQRAEVAKAATGPAVGATAAP